MYQSTETSAMSEEPISAHSLEKLHGLAYHGGICLEGKCFAKFDKPLDELSEGEAKSLIAMMRTWSGIKPRKNS